MATNPARWLATRRTLLGACAGLGGLAALGGAPGGLGAGTAPAAGRRPGAEARGEPRVTHVGAVDRDILGVIVEAGAVVPSRIEPYARRDGDRLVVPEEDGRLPNGDVATMFLVRGGERVGWIVGEENDHLTRFERLVGHGFRPEVAALPASWTVRSGDDPAYAEAQPPETVWRKHKPTDWVRREGYGEEAPTRYYFYLKLPRPLAEGARYAVALDPAAGLGEAAIAYAHDPARARSEAVHALHTGYRPDDPGKRAYLSVWLGDGGRHRFPDGLGFRLVAADTGEAVYAGRVDPAWPVERREAMGRGVNYNLTDVAYMDFAGFTAPGTYRVVVDGIGCSYPFAIGDGAGWRTAFRTSMQGFLNQRSGIALGPPHTDYVRPLNFHPSTTAIRRSRLRHGEGDLQDLAQARTDERVDAWGGYHDAGDFDRRSEHLEASRLHMTLLEMLPAHAGLGLGIPESGDAVPDLLDEALWNIMLYRRLQRDDGGVPHGIESSAHPRAGEPSWMESLTVVAFAPDALASYRYAAAAAQAAGLLRPYDGDRAADLERGATAAFEWAEAHRDAAPDAGQLAAEHSLAACALYKLTGGRRYREAFEATTPFAEPPEGVDEALVRHGEAAFCYVRLPAGATDPGIRANCRAAILAMAESERRYAAGNAFDVAHPLPSMPLILGHFSTPHAIGCCRAHWLTGDRRYLETAVRACHFGLGANPMNTTLTTGLGHAYPRHPLHLDSRNSGQPAPAGITVYGNNDISWEEEDGGWLTWPFRWFFGKQNYPDGYDWPVTEGYFDVFGVPSMNEFTVHQTMGPASFVWGYLAGRP